MSPPKYTDTIHHSIRNSFILSDGSALISSLWSRMTYSRKPVLPGEAAVIKIKYEPHKIEAGIFHRVIQIYTNVSDDVRLITIQGNSIDDKTSRKRRQ